MKSRELNERTAPEAPQRSPFRVVRGSTHLAVALQVAVFFVAALVMGCAADRGPVDGAAQDSASRNVELLVRPGCANSTVLEERLENVLGSTGTTMSVVDQEDLAPDDYRRGYSTPTVLVDGQDLFGLPRPRRPFPAPT